MLTDDAILRMADETSKILSQSPWHLECKHLLPTYNAMLIAARENHPEDPFLGALRPFDPTNPGDVNAPILTILFAQLRMALESLREQNGGEQNAGERMAVDGGGMRTEEGLRRTDDRGPLQSPTLNIQNQDPEADRETETRSRIPSLRAVSQISAERAELTV